MVLGKTSGVLALTEVERAGAGTYSCFVIQGAITEASNEVNITVLCKLRWINPRFWLLTETSFDNREKVKSGPKVKKVKAHRTQTPKRKII